LLGSFGRVVGIGEMSGKLVCGVILELLERKGQVMLR